jgi:hypothetical protein
MENTFCLSRLNNNAIDVKAIVRATFEGFFACYDTALRLLIA